MKLITRHQHQAMKWKNGLGETSQISIFPEGAHFAKNDFLWRLSSASIKSENLFSEFPGHDRLLTVLSGGALELQFERKTHILEAFSVIAFKGTDKIFCKPLGQEVIDFGLIFDPRQCRAVMSCQQLNTGSQILKVAPGRHLIFCAEGALQIENLELEQFETLEIDGGSEIKLRNLDDHARIISVHIENLKNTPPR